jgi:carbon-monoxide dehydrogenase large subunit
MRGPGRSNGVIGRSVPRIEDRPLLTGTSAFVDDIDPPGVLHLALLRSPHGHARIERLDVTAARAHPGVADVVTAEDIPDDVLIPMRMYSMPGMERFLQPPLARDRARYSGEPLAAVVAESRYVAEDAVELIEAEFEPLDAVTDGPEALADGAPILFPEVGSNVAAEFEIAHGDIEDAFAAAHLVVSERVRCQRHAAVPIETRGLVAAPQESGERLTVWGAAKVVHVNRRILAKLLGWTEERLRLIESDVGGGFGARGEFYPEDYLVPFCALRLGRPVKWIEDREEHLRAINHSREQIHQIDLALSEGGEFLGLRDRITFNTGAYVRTHGTVVPSMSAALLPGPYRWGAYRAEVRQVVTNKTPAGTYRAPGRYETNFARERIIDIAARRLDVDPVALRRSNLVQPAAMPYTTGTHTEGHPVAYDSGDYPLLLDKGLERFGLEEMLAWRRAEAPPGRRRGLGVAFFVEKSGIARWDYARVELNDAGLAVVHVGSASLGQGVETVLAQICAESLGVRYEDVAAVHHGDTNDVPDGVGSFGSRATMIAGTAVLQAAGVLRARILERAADMLEAAEHDLVIVDGSVAVKGSPTCAISLREIAARATGPTGAAELSEESRFHSEDMSFPYGLHCAAVEVDTGTGGVEIHRYAITYDVGRAVNPTLVEGQVVGGAAQGIGGALLEELVYDPAGQLNTGSLMDYLLPTAGEVPRIEVLVTEDAPTPLTPLGAKGAGEGGTAAAGAAVANAVSDAIGAEVTELPLHPERVLRLLSQRT